MATLNNRSALEQRVYDYLEQQIQTQIDRGDLTDTTALAQQLSALTDASPTPVDWLYLTVNYFARTPAQQWRLALRERVKLFHVDGLKSVNKTQRLWRKEAAYA